MHIELDDYEQLGQHRNMRFMTREEVAKYLRVHPRTIMRWLQSSELKGHKLGKGKTALWRIPEEEVKRFLAKHKNK